MIKTILQKLGLGTEETNVYLLLLKEGPLTAGKLARQLGTPRSSLYGYLKRLHDKGLVFQSMKWGVKTFSAEAPEKINLLLDQELEDLKDKQKSFQKILPELAKSDPLQVLAPRFHLFEGQEGVKHVLRDMLTYSDMETQAFWPIRAMLDILSPDFFRYLNKERIKKRLYTRGIWPAAQVVSVKTHPYLGVGPEFYRELRVAPRGVDFTMGYWIYGHKVALVSSKRESFGFIIESAEFAAMLKSQFEVVWKLSTPLRVNPKDTEGFLRDAGLRS